MQVYLPDLRSHKGERKENFHVQLFFSAKKKPVFLVVQIDARNIYSESNDLLFLILSFHTSSILVF